LLITEKFIENILPIKAPHRVWLDNRVVSTFCKRRACAFINNFLKPAATNVNRVTIWDDCTHIFLRLLKLWFAFRLRANACRCFNINLLPFDERPVALFPALQALLLGALKMLTKFPPLEMKSLNFHPILKNNGNANVFLKFGQRHAVQLNSSNREGTAKDSHRCSLPHSLPVLVQSQNNHVDCEYFTKTKP